MRYASRIAAAGLLVALTSATFVACKKEKEQNGPSISIPAETGVITGDLTLPPGTHSLRFKFIAQKGSGKDDADLKSYSFTVNPGTGATQTIKSGNISGATFTYDTTLGEINGVNGQILTFAFTVTDKNDKSASRNIKITFGDMSTGGGQPTRYIDSLINGNFDSSNNAANHLQYANNTLIIRSRSQAEANPDKILFVYYYSTLFACNSDTGFKRHSLISPAILGNSSLYLNTPIWWNNNSTKTTTFKVVQGNFSFDNISYDQIKQAYTSGMQMSGEYVNNMNQRIACLESDNQTKRLIAFNQDNIYGIVRVDNARCNVTSAQLSIKVARPQ